jgi:hypothetical protein
MLNQTLYAFAALAAALLALFVYHRAAVKPRLAALDALLAVHDELLGAGAGPASARLASLEEQCSQLQQRAQRAEERLRELDAGSRTDLSRTGFVRYDAFDDTGSELSYALALLNREGDGVVLSSIYSREDVRTFGKAVRGWKPSSNASAEELAAIAKAREASA